MSFPRYPKYKASGVEWLGEVPQHWEVRRLSSLSSKITNGYVGPTRDIFVDEGVRYLQSLHIKRNRIRFDVPYFVSQEWSDQHAKSILEAGDVLIVQTGDIGQVTVVPNEFAGCNCHALIVVAPVRDVVDGEWISWLLNSDYGLHTLLSIQTGALHPHLNCGDVKDISITLPPRDEQTKIASFLDREMSKIDGLVGEQRRLMELLKEKRQAVISHAVTKGLNPHAPRKSSGIKWLGDVPEHWEVLSLRRVSSSVQTGGTPSSVLPADEVDAGQVWYTPGDFGDSLRLTTSARMLPLEVAASGDAKVFPPRSVLVVSIGATLGKVGFAEGVSAANQQINAVIPNEKIDGYFCAYSLSAKAEVMRFLSNASTIGIMNQEKTKDIWLAVPTMSEQVEITAHLDHATTKLDALTAEAERGIELLQERRTALISAAVTGQIDVRGLVIP